MWHKSSQKQNEISVMKRPPLGSSRLLQRTTSGYSSQSRYPRKRRKSGLSNSLRVVRLDSLVLKVRPTVLRSVEHGIMLPDVVH